MSNCVGRKAGIVWPTIRASSGKRVRAHLRVRSPEPPPKKRGEGEEAEGDVRPYGVAQAPVFQCR